MSLFSLLEHKGEKVSSPLEDDYTESDEMAEDENENYEDNYDQEHGDHGTEVEGSEDVEYGDDHERYDDDIEDGEIGGKIKAFDLIKVFHLLINKSID